MREVKFFGIAAVLYFVVFYALASAASAPLIANDIGALYLVYENSGASVPIVPIDCKRTAAAGTACHIMLNGTAIRVRYQLIEPIQTHGFTVDSLHCDVLLGDASQTCTTMWLDHPQRRVAMINVADDQGARLLKAAQERFPLQNLPEATWMQVAKLHAILIGLTLLALSRLVALPLKVRAFSLLPIAIVSWQVAFLLGLIALRYLVD
jgi:hypothetical protein